MSSSQTLFATIKGTEQIAFTQGSFILQMLEEATALEGQWKPNPYVTRPVKKAKKPAAGKDVTIGLINGRAARSSNSSQPRGRMGTPSREKQAQKSSNNQQSLLQTPGPDKKQQDSGRDTVAIDQENGHTEPASGRRFNLASEQSML